MFNFLIRRTLRASALYLFAMLKIPVNPLVVVVMIFACSTPKRPADKPTLFSLLPADSTGITFRNDIVDNENFNIFSYRNFYNGGGVATGDINNDGLPDVFLTANMGANKLYVNKGNFKFDDISEKAGIAEKEKWSTGVVMADVNADGWLDIYVCNAGYKKGLNTKNALFINNKNGTFTDSAQAYGLDNDGYTTHAAFFDYDLDGDLDCYILNNSFIPVNTLNNSNNRTLRAKDWPVADFLKGGGSFLMRNDGGKFVDVSEQAGIYGSLISFGLGVTVGDVNGDQYPDIYVSNDFFERDYLYINQKNGTYKEELEQWTQHISQSSMGADLADVNNDGYPDLFVTDMLPDQDYRLKTTSSFENYDFYRLKVKQDFHHQFMQNTLQINNRNGKFMEAAHYSGIAASDWSWGGLVFDADNDGLSDLYVCNGIARDVTDQDFIDFFANDIIQRMVMTGTKDKVQEVIDKMPSNPILNKAFRNRGDLKFDDAGVEWGFTKPSFSNGASYADLDNDGDLDMVINNVNEQAFVYRNNGRQINQNNYINIKLKGKGKNTFAVGATVRVFSGNEIITRETIPSRGFQSSVDYSSLIGLGKNVADSVYIIWPDKTFTTIIKPEINKTIVYDWPTNAPQYKLQQTIYQPMFQPVAATFEKHTEDDYVDFYTERNMPVMVSREGPKAAVADVNRDGLDDVYIGGAAGQAGQLYLQKNNGYVKAVVPDFVRFASFEDVATVFFDADNDGDPDLMVGSGGNNVAVGLTEMQNRLYKNDGKGNFTIDANALPQNTGNTSAIAPYDFDGDGDLDLFVASKCVPQQYGALPTHYLLQNDGHGKFEDVTESIFPECKKLSFITSVIWANVSGDKKSELIVAGEWMTPMIFTYTNGKLILVKNNLDNLFGWWQSLAAVDVDGDGDEDLVLGNIGENCYLKPDSLHPVKLWYNDFDGNQLFDKIMTRTINNKDVPVFLKRDLTDQIPSLKKQNLKFEAFANKSVQELFTPPIIDKSKVYLFNYGSSCVAINNGQGNFTIKKLPTVAQFSSICAIYATDLNGDKKPDLILGGNQLAMLPQFGQLDGSYGNILLNANAGNFDWLEPKKSGVEITGAIKDIKFINGKAGGYLFLRNDESPVLMRFKALNK